MGVVNRLPRHTIALTLAACALYAIVLCVIIAWSYRGTPWGNWLQDRQQARALYETRER